MRFCEKELEKNWKLALMARVFGAASLFELRQRLEWVPDGAGWLEWLGVEEAHELLELPPLVMCAAFVQTDAALTELRQQAHYWRAQHARAVEREGRYKQQALELERTVREQ